MRNSNIWHKLTYMMASQACFLLLVSLVGYSLCQTPPASPTPQVGKVYDVAKQAVGSHSIHVAGTKGPALPLYCGKVCLKSYDYRFRRYTIRGAAKVLSLSLLREETHDVCKKDKTFGTYGTDVWVNTGCRGIFAICFVPGYNKIVLSCHSLKFKPKKCYVGQDIKTVTIARHRSGSPCIEGFSYKIDGKDLVVFNGCRADFIVGWH
ncbi:D-galacturonic acid binding lectin [Elysia marginata]|uniref:D-galacturonic acid binding lectin n=1 Tax=Elysia marginata TaxID=1093978 RepID=A0AAV4HGR9_9GAST|nr:D-galacturonic acid binding lectin [Elysia marginata]